MSNPNTCCNNADDEKKGIRSTQWFAIMSFSIIALAAVVTNFNDNTKIGDQSSEVKWVISAISIAFSFAMISVVAILFIPDKFPNTYLETGMATFTLGFWTAAMPIIMDPEHNLAVESYISGVSNLNLYFFSWAAFLLSFLNFITCVCDTIDTIWKTDNNTNTTTTKHNEKRCCRSLWSGCIVMSFVVMIAASRIYKDIECGDELNILDVATDYDAMCDRTKYGVSLGAISAVFGLVWMIMSAFWMKGTLGTMIEFGLVTFLTMVWTVGVVLLTFDKEKSPGHGLGNLYFFTWGGWSLCVFLFISSFTNAMSCFTEETDQIEGNKEEMKDKPPMEKVEEEGQFATTTDV